MATRTALRITALSSAGLALFIAGLALGQYQAPTDYKGVQESVLAAIDLTKESTALTTVSCGSAGRA